MTTTSVCTHTHTHAQKNKKKKTDTHSHVRTYAHTHTNTHTQTNKHVRTHRYTISHTYVACSSRQNFDIACLRRHNTALEARRKAPYMLQSLDTNRSRALAVDGNASRLPCRALTVAQGSHDLRDSGVGTRRDVLLGKTWASLLRRSKSDDSTDVMMDGNTRRG